MKIKVIIGLFLCIGISHAQEQAVTPSSSASPLHKTLREHPEIKAVVDPQKPFVEEIPTTISKTNHRFITLNLENDFFGNGTDKDYTNGMRITYMDMGSEQPFYVDWLDTLSPTFEVNESTSHYFSLGHNLYTPEDIEVEDLTLADRPYAGFAYMSGGLTTATGNHIDNAEITLGWVGPSARGSDIQKRYHKLIDTRTPRGWHHQLRDEPGFILSMERQWPQFLSFNTTNDLQFRLTPHVGGSLGNIYTYANTGITLSLSPDDGRLQDSPTRVRPAMPGSGFFLSKDNKWSWQAYLGIDTRVVARNIFLDGNTFKNSHSVNKNPFVIDAVIGVAVNYDNIRIGYSMNWRSKEFSSPLSKEQVFGAVTFSYRY